MTRWFDSGCSGVFGRPGRKRGRKNGEVGFDSGLEVGVGDVDGGLGDGQGREGSEKEEE